MKRLLAWSLVGALALAAHGAHAADPQATKLFQQGLKLFERGEIKAACEKFEQSYDIDPAPGTLGNLATCFERLGEYSRAHKAFVELARRAQDAGKTDRVDVYRTRATELESKLPKIMLGGANASAWKELKIDGVDVPRDKWTTPMPAEEGPHKLRFASGETSRTITVNVPHDGTVSAEFPAPDASTAITPPTPSTPPPDATPTPRKTETPETTPSSSSHFPWPYVLAGAGGAAMVVGGVFGLKAIGDKSDATDACPGHVCPSAQAAARANDARLSSETAATVSTLCVAWGLALVGAGAVVYVFTRSGDVSVAPAVGVRTGGASLSVRF